MVYGFSSADPSLATDGFSSADLSLAGGSQEPATNSSSGGGGSSTLATPTPGASELTGTSQEREAQIAAFRSGGSSALAQERAKVETRVAEQKRIEQIRLDARALESHKEVQAKASQELARREAIRIEEFKESLALRGADVVSKTYDKSGTKTDVTIIRDTGERVFTTTDLTSGKKTTIVYEKPEGARHVQITSKLTETPANAIKEVIPGIGDADISTITKPEVTDKQIKPPEITAYKDPTFYKQSWLESGKQSLQTVGENIRTFFSGRTHDYKSIVEPFRYSGELKEEKVAYTDPLFGTIITSPITGLPETGEVTYGDIQKKIETKRQF